ncbi:hypothetical protein ACLQ3H_03725 [Micromonospora saelicesensis]|uniref:hypothetical protein n=1 Tax=Micromonospora saelicesensis TaxID=285676 RepID=UPI003CF6C341
MRMNAAVDSIRELSHQIDGSGFGAAVADPEKRHATIYWKGQVPQAIQTLIDGQSRIVPINVLPAKYTEQEMLRDSKLLAKRQDVAQVGPSPDAQGVQVKLHPGTAVPTTSSLRASTGIASDILFRGFAGKRAMVTRQNDSTPYYAGARTNLNRLGNCTTSFTVNHGGRTKLLYAAHCGTTVTDGANDAMGAVTNRNTTRDISLIDVRGSARVWDGPWNESSYTKAVQGATFSNVGNTLCTSGSFSGIRCGIKVTANNQYSGGYGPLVYAQKTDHGSAAGGGDSGGPVFQLPSPNNGKVIAKGIILATHLNASAPCVGAATHSCAWEFDYADVTQTMSFLGATIATG